jgi:Domain of unknown function (DUF222)/HNH endonuclease
MCSTEISVAPDRTRPLEILEREITALTSEIHAATCRWLCLIAEYDARGGWGEWGCKSCAHWVSWQCGIAPGVAREHMRVARRLVQLPLVRAAFAQGELSYSKVRALTRVENIADEAELLRLARTATASQLERLLRAYRRIVRTERGAAEGRPERWLECAHDDDGGVVIRGRLPAEEGVLVVAALRAARDRLARDDVPAGTPGDDRVRSYAGQSLPSRTAEGVPAGTPKPTIAEARADALLLLADSFLAGGSGPRTGGDRYQVVVHVDSATLGDDSGKRCELDDGMPLAADTARRLACDASLVRVLERDGVPLKLGRKTRTIPPPLRRALNARDGGCRFPGCTSRRFVDAHHIEHWAHGGATDLDNLVQLCRHHHRLLHEGRYGIARTPSGGLAFSRRDGRRIPIVARGRDAPPAPLAPTRRPNACVSLSEGQRMDLALAVEAMFACAPIASTEPPGV